MSRIGKQPVTVPSGVTVKVDGRTVTAEGPKGKLSLDTRPEVKVEVDKDSGSVVITRKRDDRSSREFHGLTRALINNMVTGVKEGYEKKLELQGVGYVVRLEGNQLSLRVGFANEVRKPIPQGLSVTCPDNTHIHISGCDKQLVGEFAAEVRSIRKPEPYKGKGVRYLGEHVKIKPGKTAT
jgi:large subunit ribosomal protein L6